LSINSHICFKIQITAKSAVFFDEQHKLDRISELGDPLERLDKAIDWSLFSATLNKHLRAEASGPGGRPPFDYVMMFKILILQEYFGLRDERLEFQITDRFSFMRFLGLQTYSKVPDSNTIWHFRERLKEGNVVRQLFERFNKQLKKHNLIVNKGKIVDASIVQVPRQRNTREENQSIKEGEIPESWSGKKRSHKDTGARWLKKNKLNFYGYKNHIKVDSKSKFVDAYCVTDSSVHDSLGVVPLLIKKDRGQPLYGDNAYSGEPFEEKGSKVKMKNKTHDKGYRGNPLTSKRKKINTTKSSVRARVEHVFGFLHQATRGLIIRPVGMARAEIKIGLKNLTYNLCRYSFITQR